MYCLKFECFVLVSCWSCCFILLWNPKQKSKIKYACLGNQKEKFTYNKSYNI